MSTFQGVRVGQRVFFWQYAGCGTKGPEYKRANGRVAMAFADHLVLNIGGEAWDSPSGK